MKKILITLGVILVLLLGSLVAIPYFFKDQIVDAVKKAANESLTATLEFSDVDISVFRHFPKLTVGLKDLQITNGPGPFEGVKLMTCEQLDVSVDLWAAIFGGHVIIKGLDLNKPELKVYALSNGDANYDITKPTDEVAATSTEPETPIQLERYGITDGKLLYDDRGLDMVMEMSGLAHEGSGALTSTIFDLVMKTAVQELSVNYGGVQYLRNANTTWNATVHADMNKMRFEMAKNEAKVNNLQLDFNGWFEMPNETDILMDLTFGTPQNTFKSLLSIVPGAYTKDFEQVKADGTVQFNGMAKGKYNETTYPAFKLDFKVGDASVQYPSLPLGISNINVDAAINSPGPTLNPMTINIPKFGLRIGSNPLEGYFNLKTPVTDPTVDTKVKGTLNLAELSKAFPMEGVQALSGIIRADILLKAAMSQIDAQQYDQVNVAGTLGIEGINYRAAGSPDIRINALSSTFSPQRVDIQNLDANFGKTDFRANASIDNILAYFSTNKTMRGTLNFASNKVDANEWMTPTPTTASGEVVVPNDVPAASEKVFDRWDFTMDGKIGQLVYDTYNISNMAMQGHFTPNKMNVSNFGLRMGESDLSGNGQINNAWNYLFDNQTVTGIINLNSSYFDLNQFMTEPTTTASTAGAPPPASGVMPVPEHMDMTVNANFAKVQYTNMTLSNLNGAIAVKNESATLKDCIATVLGGQVALNGEYNTLDLSKPLFNMDMALQNFGFKEAFQQFVTVKKLAPIAQLMDGKFNTTLSLSGMLGQDMTPDLNTMSAAGFLETINAVINNFKGLNTIGEKLNVDYLKRLDLGNTRNWFEIKNGAVVVKPFDCKVKDVAMKIGGSHSISNDMSYQIVTKVPRKLLGNAANGGLNYLSSEASKYGVNIAQGEFINTRFDITGSLFNPKVAMKILGSDGEATLQDQVTATATDYVNKAKDSLSRVANKELDKAKQKAMDAADKIQDSLSRLADKKIEEAKNKAIEQAKEQAGKVVGKEVGDKVGDVVGDKAGKKAEEVLGDKGKKTVEDAKGKLEKWDPFKKKKD